MRSPSAAASSIKAKGIEFNVYRCHCYVEESALYSVVMIQAGIRASRWNCLAMPVVRVVESSTRRGPRDLGSRYLANYHLHAVSKEHHMVLEQTNKCGVDVDVTDPMAQDVIHESLPNKICLHATLS